MKRNVQLRIVNYVISKDVSAGVYPNILGSVKNFDFLDLYDNESINVNLQTQDLKNPIVKKTSYSGSFKLPATDKNNILLGWSYLINDSIGIGEGKLSKINLFNYSVDVQLYINDIFIFDGTLQLTNINRNIFGVNYEVTFILNNQSLYALLKDIRFEDPYISKATKNNEYQSVEILPKNWIWDSIIFENYTKDGVNASKTNLFPLLSTPSPVFPFQVNKNPSDLILHAIKSWGDTTSETNALNSKHYWGFLDDGKIKNIVDGQNIRSITDSNSIINNLSTDVEANKRYNAFSLFENIRPYYYVGDIIRRLLKYIEYGLNSERYGILDLFSSNGIQYYAFNNPLTPMDINIPIRFYYDTDLMYFESDVNKKAGILDKLVMVSPENESYKNPDIRVEVGYRYNYRNTGGPFNVTSSTVNVTRYPIDFLGTASNWDTHQGIMSIFFQTKVVNDSALRELKLEMRVYYNDVLAFSEDFLPNLVVGLNTYDIFINFYTEETSYTNGLTGFKRNIKVELEESGIYDDYIHTLVLWDDAELTLDRTVDEGGPTDNLRFRTLIYDTSQTIDYGYDLRRYLYPAMSEHSMSDFMIDIFKLFNTKTDSPIFQSLVSQTTLYPDTKISKYVDLFQDSKIIPLTENVDIFNISKKSLIYRDLYLNYAENGDDLQELYKNSISSGLVYGSKYLNFNQVEGYAKDSIKLDLKCSIPTFLSNNLKQDGPSKWLVPSIFDTDEQVSNNEYAIKPYSKYKNCFLFKDIATYSVDTNLKIDRTIFNTTTSITNNQFLLPRLTPFYNNPSTNTIEEVLVYDLTTSNQLQKQLEQSGLNVDINGYDFYYKDEIESLQSGTIINLDIDLSLLELINTNFTNIYTIDISGETSYYRLNKIGNYDLRVDRKLAKAEFIQYDYIKNRTGIYSEKIVFTSENQIKPTVYYTTFLEVDYRNGLTGSTATFSNCELLLERFKNWKQNVIVNAGTGSIFKVSDGVSSASLPTISNPETFELETNSVGGVGLTRL